MKTYHCLCMNKYTALGSSTIIYDYEIISSYKDREIQGQSLMKYIYTFIYPIFNFITYMHYSFKL